MCGIAGCFGPRVPDDAVVERALAALRHRGPDGNGIVRGDAGRMPFTLLHTRLAIIDTDARSNQPFEAGDLVLTFNGEIYNYVELREDLLRLGHIFRTESDTEVLIAAWREWGEGALDRMEGMWAFAIVDRRDGRVVLSRDPFGEKPLFVTTVGDTVYFASEMRALSILSGRRPEVNTDHLRRCLVHDSRGLTRGTGSFLKNVEEFPPATVQVFGPGSTGPRRRYWSLTYSPVPMTAQDALDGVRERLNEAVRIRLRTDVPLAFCLSGGIDSSALAGITSRHFGHDGISTYSIIDSDPRYDESAFIDAGIAFWNARNMRHHVDGQGVLDRIRALTRHRLEPVLTVTTYVHSYLVDAIAHDGIKVALSGNGADEIFTGYYDHYSFWLADQAGSPGHDDRVADWRRTYGAVVRNPYLQDPDVFVAAPDERRHLYIMGATTNDFLVEPIDEAPLDRPLTENVLRNRLLNELFYEVVPALLRDADYNSMMVSVENRSPFLDRKLCEFLCTVPNEHLIRNGYPKWLLREAVAGLIPDEIRLNREKRGFNVAFDRLVDRSDPTTRGMLLEDSPIFDIVRRDAVRDMLDRETLDVARTKFLFLFVSAKAFVESVAEGGGTL